MTEFPGPFRPTAETSLRFVNQYKELAWPPVPNPWAGGVGALLYQFEQTQWWPEADIHERRLQQAKLVLAHAYETVPFYRELYERHGLDPETVQSGDAWRRVPIVDRKGLQAAGDTWHSNDVPTAHGELIRHFTSGSSGRPLDSRSTTLTHLFKVAVMLRQHSWARRDLSQKAALFEDLDEVQFPEGQLSPSWENATRHVIETGPSLSISLHQDAAVQLDLIREHRPAYLFGYPSILENLADHSRRNGIALPFLRQVGTFGEVLEPSCRCAVREAWGIGVADLYSAMEIGPIALQCPEREHYHVQAETVWLEVLDEDGNECGPGECGRVVLTSLHNFAAPLIRYEIGDLAVKGERCACGRTLPVLARILGRQRNMLRYPDGTARWPNLRESDFVKVFAAAGGMPPVQQFQLVQHDRERIEARLVVARPYTAAEEAKLTEFLHGQFGDHWQVNFSYPSVIERGPSGKFEDFLSHCA